MRYARCFKLKKKNILRIAAAVLVTAAFALAAAFFTRTDTQWYEELIKPAIQPPALVFGIVWAVIYALFAASFALTLIKREGKGALLYILNLALTTMWCLIFFVRMDIGAALVLLIIIFILAIILTFFAYNSSAAAGVLITPYALWMGYALAINYGVVLMN